MRFDRTKRHREAQIPENFPGAHFCSVAWVGANLRTDDPAELISKELKEKTMLVDLIFK